MHIKALLLPALPAIAIASAASAAAFEPMTTARYCFDNEKSAFVSCGSATRVLTARRDSEAATIVPEDAHATTVAPEINLAKTSLKGFGCWTAKHKKCLPYTSKCRVFSHETCLYAPRSKCHHAPKPIICKPKRAEAGSDMEEVYTLVVPTGTVDPMVTPDPEMNEDMLLAHRTGFDMAQMLATAIPSSVQDAILHDPKAPKSLANEFSGDKVPEWYHRLPDEAQQMYQRPGKPRPKVSAKEAKSAIRKAKAEASLASKEAGSLSKFAKYESQLAKLKQDSTMAAWASKASATAVSISKAAASQSAMVRSSASTLVSSPMSNLVYTASLTAAVTFLVLAVFL